MKHFRRLLRSRPLVGVLVLLVGLQGLAAGVLGALGPSHVHRVAAAAPADATDWSLIARLSPPKAAATAPHSHGLGPFSASGSPARHHHAGSDASVVVVDPLADLGLDETGSIAALLILLAVLPTAMRWSARQGSTAPLARAAWHVLRQIPAPPERPPQPA